jgi:hypothetical protein
MESGQPPVVTGLKATKLEKEPDALPERLRLLNGFPRTARFLAADPDKSLVIVRRFDEVAIRNLLFLEGRVAALEDVQKRLDNEDFEEYKDNTAVTLAAQSWEYFALMGSGDSDRSKIPESVLSLWCADRAKLIQREVDKQEEWDNEDRDPEYEHMKQAVRLYQFIQNRIQDCDRELRTLRHTSTENTPFNPDIPGRRAELEWLPKDLLMDQKLALGYSEKDLHARPMQVGDCEGSTSRFEGLSRGRASISSHVEA